MEKEEEVDRREEKKDEAKTNSQFSCRKLEFDFAPLSLALSCLFAELMRRQAGRQAVEKSWAKNEFSSSSSSFQPDKQAV